MPPLERPTEKLLFLKRYSVFFASRNAAVLFPSTIAEVRPRPQK
jgi:hypothetical protein